MRVYKTYTCGCCRFEFKTRRSFYVCEQCAAITCKACLGNGCAPECRSVVSVFSRLIDALPRLGAAGFDVSVWSLP